jgi:chromate transporter
MAEPPCADLRPGPGRLGEVLATFLPLGCLSFGGPAAHVGYFRNEVVLRRRWLDEARFADLVALCQALPGPGSSQLVYALGMHRAGLPGAIVASLAFTLPSALLMLGFAYGLASGTDVTSLNWVRGLLVAAVAVVAQAVWGMGARLCPDRQRQLVAVTAAVLLLVAPSAGTQLAVLAGGALWGILRPSVSSPDPTTPAPAPASGTVPPGAYAALLLFFLLLLLSPLASRSPERPLQVMAVFYRVGSFVFGGGHVVLPLLRAEVVPRGWLTDPEFLAGYGAAQALPGPLFTFSAYVGAAMAPGPPRWVQGLLALAAVFLPAWLLVGGVLPFWDRLRRKVRVQTALAGVNAAVVGVLLAAFWDPVLREGLRTPRDAALALAAFHLLENWRAPPWVVVALCAAIAA